MWTPRSAAFDAAVTDGATAIARADLYKNNVLIKSGLPILSGRVSIDETAASQRTFNGIIVDEDGLWAPVLSTDLFTPYGSELQIWSGYLLQTGVVELLPMIRCRLEDVETDGTIIQCGGPDRSVVIQEGRPEIPYVIANGVNLGTAIRALLDTRFPGLDYTGFGVTSVTISGPIILEETSDMWQEAQDLAASNGFELFFDQVGKPIFRKKLDPTFAALAWTYAPGEDNIILDAKRRFSSRGLKNVWVAKGNPNGTEVAVRASAEITSPVNPLFPQAGFGRRPEFFASQYLSTIPQCQAVADGLKVAKAGFGDTVKFRAIPHPAHEAGDVAKLMNAAIGIDDPFVLSSWDIDVLLHEPIEFVTRARRNA